jgi:hypothetical protein
MWMIGQADKQGIKFAQKVIQNNGWDTVTDPLLHDKSSNLINGAANGGPTSNSGDRDVIYADGTVVKQRKTTSGMMSYADTLPYIIYKANPLTSDYISGTVNINGYLQWLNAHGYDMKIMAQ